jgi:hypothetical protein
MIHFFKFVNLDEISRKVRIPIIKFTLKFQNPSYLITMNVRTNKIVGLQSDLLMLQSFFPMES